MPATATKKPAKATNPALETSRAIAEETKLNALRDSMATRPRGSAGFDAICSSLNELGEATKNHCQNDAVGWSLELPPDSWRDSLSNAIKVFAKNLDSLTTRRHFVLAEKMEKLCLELRQAGERGHNWQQSYQWSAQFFLETLAGVFDAYSDVDEPLGERRTRTVTLETIDELDAQKVGDWQIAKIYNLENEWGEVDVDRVKRIRRGEEDAPTVLPRKVEVDDYLPVELPPCLATREVALSIPG